MHMEIAAHDCVGMLAQMEEQLAGEGQNSQEMEDTEDVEGGG